MNLVTVFSKSKHDDSKHAAGAKDMCLNSSQLAESKVQNAAKSDNVPAVNFPKVLSALMRSTAQLRCGG